MRAVYGVLVALLVPACGCGGAGSAAGPATYGDDEIKAAVIDTCEKAVRKDLRDPDSAKFGDDWKAWIVTSSTKPPTVSEWHPESGDKFWSAGGEVNAKNGFGGYGGGEPYGCDAVVTSAGGVHARAYSMASVLSSVGSSVPVDSGGVN